MNVRLAVSEAKRDVAISSDVKEQVFTLSCQTNVIGETVQLAPSQGGDEVGKQTFPLPPRPSFAEAIKLITIESLTSMMDDFIILMGKSIESKDSATEKLCLTTIILIEIEIHRRGYA
jgi:hypothetical protein